ncbi:hypothetical protein [Flavobacterium sp.]|uniref:hypothetical protein n=1 Tax=Flavobacterium sp. TaxID=239 RepID=UPI0011F8F471|nr:hypothetical protein [Flavobacterium sp.]RZJ72505.1 MAG: hypothetical protein EOO49_06215 [Flavobacterium sp.]
MKRIFGLFALLVAASSYGQKTLSKDYEYKVSSPYKYVDADDKYYLSEEGKAVKVSFDKRDIYVQKFDPATGNEVSSKFYEDAVAKNTVFERILFINGKAVIFLTQWDGDNKKEQLYTQEVNMDTGILQGEKQLLLKIDGKVTGEGSGRMMDFNLVNKFPVYRSFDNKKFLVKYRRIPEVKNDKKSFDKIGFVIFDENMKEISNREVTMPYTERRMNNLDYQLDNNGDLYLLTKVYHDDSGDDKKSKKDEEANYHLEMMVLKAGAKEFKTAQIENGNKFINSVQMYDIPNGNGVIAAGFYSNGRGKDFQSASDGAITFRVSPDAEVGKVHYYDIPVEIINEYSSKKAIRKNEKKEESGEGAKFGNLVFRELKIMPDGSIFMAAEQYILVVSTHYSSSGTRTTYSYNYNSVLVLKADKEGNLQWMKKIPKFQHGSRGRGGMSFEHFENGSEHFLVFFDNVKNIDLPVDKVPAMHNDGHGGYLTAVKIDDKTGDISKGSILNVREIEDYKLKEMSMEKMMHTSNDSFMFEAYKKGKEDIMIVVKLK